ASPPHRLPLRRVDELSAAGNVFHTPDAAPRDGRLQARIAGVELGPTALPIGELQLRVEQLDLDGAEDIEVAFLGLTPRIARGTLRGLRVTALAIEREATAPAPAHHAAPHASAPP